MSLVPTIGLEVHCQLATDSKMFCACPVVHDAPPNSAVCSICLGHPGALPLLNAHAVTLGIRAGLALGCTIDSASVFARKHYFYPDLPKGYQITQFDRPLCSAGTLHVQMDGQRHRFGIHRIHLEEDAGKMRHTDEGSLVDWNRGGTPLIEIVGEPDLHSPQQAGAWLRMLHRVVVAAGVTSGDMEKGHFRCDANVSVAPEGGPLGTRVELKNINSFRFVERALHTEIERQKKIISQGGSVTQATRTWVGEQTVMLRSKEEAADYRYFPDPDLPVLVVQPSEIDAAAQALAGVPLDVALLDEDEARLRALVEVHGLREEDGVALLAHPALLACFEQAVGAGGGPQAMVNWLRGPVSAILNASGQVLGDTCLVPTHLVSLEALVQEGSINRGTARGVLEKLMQEGGSAQEIIDAQGLTQVDDAQTLRVAVDDALERHPEAAARLVAGEAKLMGFFLGEVMRSFQGRADPQAVRRELETRLRGQ